MSTVFLATFTVTKPVAVGIGVAALIVLFLAFKAVKFIFKILLALAALLAIGLAVWWYLQTHHGSL